MESFVFITIGILLFAAGAALAYYAADDKCYPGMFLGVSAMLLSIIAVAATV